MKNQILFLFACILIINSITAQNASTQVLIDKYVKSLPENAEIAIGLIQQEEVFQKGYQVKNGEVITIENSNHIFEIGSITKTFTGALMVDQIKKGNMDLETPIINYFPAKDEINTNNVKAVTLKHLVTHTSGLNEGPFQIVPPFLKAKFSAKDNPYKFVNWEHYQKYLQTDDYDYLPSEKWEYNNCGFGLLGYLVAQQENTTWESMIQKTIFDELKMTNSYPTGENIPADLFVQGYNKKGKPAAYWDMDFINPAGSIKSCSNDMIKWLQAHLNAPTGSLYETMKDKYDVKPYWKDNVMGNAWIHKIENEQNIMWHGGATGAFRAFTAIDLENQTGIVLLINFSGEHPQMRDENNKSMIRKYGFDILEALDGKEVQPMISERESEK